MEKTNRTASSLLLESNAHLEEETLSCPAWAENSMMAGSCGRGRPALQQQIYLGLALREEGDARGSVQPACKQTSEAFTTKEGKLKGAKPKYQAANCSCT